jgi:Right handed beta helix region/Pectate lyase superfamily protein
MFESRQPIGTFSRRKAVQLASACAIGAATRWMGAQGPRVSLGKEFQRAAQTSTINAKHFGAIGDGATDDTAALQAAINAAAEAKLTLTIPPGAYVVTQSLQARSGLAIWAYGARLLTSIDDLGNSGLNVPTLNIDGVRNVTVSGLAVDGQKSLYPHTEYKAGVCINNSTAITIQDCDLYGCKGDGLICFSQSPGQRNRNIVVRNTTCRGNYRLGCAITDLTRGRFFDCVFTQSLGTSPMAGVDIEPDRDSAWISDIAFHRCEFSDNGSTSGDDGAGIIISLHETPTNPQEGIRFHDCTIHDNMTVGAILYHSRDVGFHNCRIVGNGSSGISIAQTSREILVEGGLIASNMTQGITAIRDANYQLSGLEVRGVTIENNSQAAPDEYDGIQLSGSCEDIEIHDNTITGSHRYGVWVGSSVTDVSLVGNDLRGNSVGPVFPSSLVNNNAGKTSTTTSLAGA